MAVLRPAILLLCLIIPAVVGQINQLTFAWFEDEVLNDLFYPNRSAPIWVGGDGCPSIRLYNSTYLWMFGDTGVGPMRQNEQGQWCRTPGAFPRNTVAIMKDAERPQGSLPTFYYVAPVNFSSGFFQYPAGSYESNTSRFIWIGDGIMINGSLYLIGPTLGPPVNATTGKVIPNQPIVDYQDVIVYVKDPTVDPSLWKYEIHDFPNSANTTDKWKSWGGVLFIDGGYVYVWAGKLIGWGNFQDAFQTRFPINDFARFEWSTAQMYLSNGQWGPFTWNAVPKTDWAPETFSSGSLFWSCYLNSYVRTSVFPGADYLFVHTAPTVTGPWKKWQMLTVPARYRTNGNAEYILKNHPEFRNDDTELVVTFAVNGPNNDCDLWTYVPRFFRIKMTTPNPGDVFCSRGFTPSTTIAFAKMYSDNMVLQRAPANATIWGFGQAKYLIFKGTVYTPTYTAATNQWKVVLPPETAGGPYDIHVRDANYGVISLRNVMFGEVWVCSGQR